MAMAIACFLLTAGIWRDYNAIPRKIQTAALTGPPLEISHMPNDDLSRTLISAIMRLVASDCNHYRIHPTPPYLLPPS
jgi:hypothetical protein